MGANFKGTEVPFLAQIQGYSDVEIRNRLSALREAGYVAAGEDGPPTQAATPRSKSSLPPSRTEITVDGLGAATPAKFPRTAVVLEAAELADRCRVTAATLESLASNATNYEPSTLRRRAHGLVRALVAELGAKVALLAALVLAVACGGQTAADPTQAHQVPSQTAPVLREALAVECQADLGPAVRGWESQGVPLNGEHCFPLNGAYDVATDWCCSHPGVALEDQAKGVECVMTDAARAACAGQGAFALGFECDNDPLSLGDCLHLTVGAWCCTGEAAL